MIKVSNLNKYYNKNRNNELHVIDNFSFEFQDKGLYSIFGHSGCGKTTLLNVLGCMDKFDDGIVEYNTKKFSKYNPSSMDDFRNKEIGFIFQNYNLIEDYNVYDNVRNALYIMGITEKEEVKKRIDASLKAVGMYKYRKRNVLALSGGQQQRVAIARALSKNPSIILADEPTGNLDSNNTFEVMNILKEISKTKLVILVSHEKNLVDFYSDYILELKDGKLIDTRKVSSSSLTLDYDDNRNIYLKDYNKYSETINNIDFNVYSNTSESLNIDIIFRDGIMYIKSNNKSLLINDQSEIKLIDDHKDSYKDLIHTTSKYEFKNDDFDDSKLKHKHHYISFFRALKMKFFTRVKFKGKVFSSIVLIAASVLLAIFISILGNRLVVSKRSFFNNSYDSICISLTKKEKESFDTKGLYSYVTNIDNNATLISSNDSTYIDASFSRFYQTSTGYTHYDSFEIFPSKYQNNSLNLLAGKLLKNANEIVISKWIADDLLSSQRAEINGYKTYEDLLNLKISLRTTLVVNNDNNYFDDKEYCIVGIFDEESSVVYLNDIDSITTYTISDSFYVTTSLKDKMLESLEDDYTNVYDSFKGSRKIYYKNMIKESKGILIAMGISVLGIIVFLFTSMRSSIFTQVKDIGILRTVGAKKSDIINLFVAESFARCTKTLFIGYSLMFVIFAIFAEKFSLKSLGITLVSVNVFVYLSGIILIYLTSILSSLIPVSILLNRTPIEIMKKYDI